MQVSIMISCRYSHSSRAVRSGTRAVPVKTIVAKEGRKVSGKASASLLSDTQSYTLRGMFKYGLYEIFKDAYMNLAVQERSEKYMGAIWITG